MVTQLPVVLSLIVALCVSAPIDASAQGETGRPAAPDSRKGNSREPRQPRPARPRARPTVLEVISSPEACDVLLDDRPLGTTDSDGRFKIRSVPAGRHFVTVRKKGYREEGQDVSIAGGGLVTLNISLSPLPGFLSVASTTPGATIEVAGVGVFSGGISELEVPAGVHRVTMTRLGFRPHTQEVDVPRGERLRVIATLEPLPMRERLDLAEGCYTRGEFASAIAICTDVLADKPGKPRANLLLGSCYFALRRFEECTAPIAVGVLGGEEVSFPVLYFVPGDKRVPSKAFAASLTIRATVLELSVPSMPTVSWNLPLSAVSECILEPSGVSRLRLGGVRKEGKKSNRFSYLVYPAQTRLENRVVRKGKVELDARCDSCSPTPAVIHQILRLIRAGAQSPSTGD